MLSFLLFAGALHINLDDLAQQKGVIGAATYRLLKSVDNYQVEVLLTLAFVHARSRADYDLGRIARRNLGGVGAFLPPGPEREIVLAITYVIVVFSILVQGLTLRPLVVRCLGLR